MISKENIKQLSKLQQKKYRQQQKRFIAEGKRLILEAIQGKYVCELVIITNSFVDNEEKLLKSLRNKSIRYTLIPYKDFQKLSSTKTSQGIIGVFKIPDYNDIEFNERTIIALENISDPGNLGTILRSCVWFGIRTVLLSKECAEVYNPKVVRASMGAIFKLNLIDCRDLHDVISQYKLKNYKAYYTDMSGVDYRKANYSEKTIITFCNEAFGPSKDLKDVCDVSLTIPQKGSIDSLNVSAAAAIILSQIL